MAKKVRREVEKSRPAGIFVAISIGVTQGLVQNISGDGFLSWVSKADKFLYKTNGRNCVMHDC